MTVEQMISEMASLSPREKLLVVQAVWDALPWDVGTELTSHQEAELERRWGSYKADPSTALTEDEFRQNVKDRRGK